jgi:uncharacterized repeat protein (TIGR02543 family)
MPVIMQGNPGNLVKTGFSFTGWNTNTAGTGTTYTQGQVMAASNITLYAKWSLSTAYSVKYNNNGADYGGEPNDTTMYELGSAITVAGNLGNLSKNGYSFGGWNTKADGTGTNYTHTHNLINLKHRFCGTGRSLLSI